MAQIKEQNKILENNPKEMQIYQLSDQEFIFTVIKIFSALKKKQTQTKSGKSCMNKMRISTEIETIKKSRLWAKII